MDKENKTGLFLGLILIIILILYPSIDIGNKLNLLHINTEKYDYLFDNLFAIYIGILFFLSYFLSQKSFLFRGLIWICKNVSYPKAKEMSLLYATIGIILGFIGLLRKLSETVSIFLYIIIFITVIILLFLSVKSIKNNERIAVFRFNHFINIRGPGFVFIIPFIDKSVRINLNDSIPEWSKLDEDSLEKKINLIISSKYQNNKNHN